MILLLGGTSETAAIAEGLAHAGFGVLVSTATAVPLAIGRHPRIQRRCGRLDADALEHLIRELAVSAVVDAGHPYAEILHATARAAAERVPVPYFRYRRPEAVPGEPDAAVVWVADHTSAAAVAFAFGKPVLLTTGSTHLDAYVREAARRRVPLAARVLPGSAPAAACRDAGIDASRVLAARGPFSKAQNREAIRRFHAGVLVTKESGVAGGFQAKVEAARDEGCRVVVIRRPDEPAANAYDRADTLVAAVKEAVAAS